MRAVLFGRERRVPGVQRRQAIHLAEEGVPGTGEGGVGGQQVQADHVAQGQPAAWIRPCV